MIDILRYALSLCVCVCVCTHTCMHACRGPGLILGATLHYLFTLLFEAMSINQTQSLPVCLVKQSVYSGMPCLCPLRLELRVSQHTDQCFQGSRLVSSPLPALTTEVFPPPLSFVFNLWFFVSGMLTITDFINILHRYYKSPMVSVMDLTVDVVRMGWVFPVCMIHTEVQHKTSSPSK